MKIKSVAAVLLSIVFFASISSAQDVQRTELSLDQIEGSTVILTFGQSNSANYGSKDHPYMSSGNVFNYSEGKLYLAQDPLLGASGNRTSAWGILGDIMISQNIADKVTIIPIGIGSTSVGDWAEGGKHYGKLTSTLDDIAARGIHVDYILWHQGETDNNDGTTAEEYQKSFLTIRKAIRDRGIDAPIGVAVASYTTTRVCENHGNSEVIRGAQMALASDYADIFQGPDTDLLDKTYFRTDGIHFSYPGRLMHAWMWYESIAANIKSSAVRNAFIRFSRQKKGCVAFLGGSITEMKGWHDMVKEDLQARFPDTQFNFIDAGISSTGTTPHAFRLETDVLYNGMPDLLFVEAAVNDDTNEFTGTEQVRAMEGIVRHCLRINPKMDIVMLQFIYEPFIPILDEGKLPEVIMNHQKVARHYGITSINLAEEISVKLRAGDLTWKQFGGTHPLPFGHRYYANGISRLFDRQDLADSAIVPHAVPAEPLDKFCYDHGRFVDIKEAKLKGGFRYVENWEPTVRPANTRKQFVNKPFLETTGGDASLTLKFKGTAVGIFCVCGPGAGVLQYSIDGGKYQEVDTYTKWSRKLYLPWVYMFAQELENKEHTLRLKVKEGERMDCQIRNFVVNE